MARTIEQVMTSDVETVSADAPLIEAAKLMEKRDIGDVVVVDDAGESVSGIVTDRDITVRGIASGANPGETPVRDVMSRDPVCLSPDQSVDDAVELMREHAVRRVPVVRDGAVAGIISLGDLAIERDDASALGEISAANPNN
jgi:CBS domain-containing protein